MTVKKIIYFNFCVIFMTYIFPNYIVFVLPQVSTVFSENYRETAFNKIKILMSKDDVHSIIGRPISIYEYQRQNNKITIYSYSINRWNTLVYQTRIIEFYDGKVQTITKDFNCQL